MKGKTRRTVKIRYTTLPTQENRLSRGKVNNRLTKKKPNAVLKILSLRLNRFKASITHPTIADPKKGPIKPKARYSSARKEEPIPWPER